MITSLLFVLLLLTLCAFVIGRRKVAIITIVVTLVVFWLSGSGLLSGWLLSGLQTPYLPKPITWGNSNTIVVLGAGSTTLPNNQVMTTVFGYGRVYHAANAYLACKKEANVCRILVSGGDPLHTGKSEADIYRQLLLALGVKDQDILVESHSHNTFENAKNTATILQQDSSGQILLATSGFHLDRALLYFSYFDIQATPIMADYLNTTFYWLPSAYSLMMSDLAVHEYVGIARFYLYNFFGLNAKPANTN